MSVASTPCTFFLTALLRLEHVFALMCARDCVCVVRVCFWPPQARSLRAFLSRSVIRSAVALGSVPLFRESIATKQTIAQCTPIFVEHLWRLFSMHLTLIAHTLTTSALYQDNCGLECCRSANPRESRSHLALEMQVNHFVHSLLSLR